MTKKEKSFKNTHKLHENSLKKKNFKWNINIWQKKSFENTHKLHENSKTNLDAQNEFAPKRQKKGLRSETTHDNLIGLKEKRNIFRIKINPLTAKPLSRRKQIIFLNCPILFYIRIYQIYDFWKISAFKSLHLNKKYFKWNTDRKTSLQIHYYIFPWIFR